MEGRTESAEQIRTAELVAALCLATDLGMGFPLEHGLQRTLIAIRLADRLGVDRETTSQTYYAALLSHAGCTTDAHVTAELFGDSLTKHLHPVMYGSRRQVMRAIMRALPPPESAGSARVLELARRLPKTAREQRPHLTAMCEVAEMLAEGVGASRAMSGLLAQMTERWDGKGPLGRAKGDEIPLAMRIVHVASDAAYHRLLGDEAQVARVIGERAGRGLDPQVAASLADHAREILARDAAAPAWDEVLACEPRPALMLRGMRSIGRSRRWVTSPT